MADFVNHQEAAGIVVMARREAAPLLEVAYKEAATLVANPKPARSLDTPPSAWQALRSDRILTTFLEFVTRRSATRVSVQDALPMCDSSGVDLSFPIQWHRFSPVLV